MLLDIDELNCGSLCAVMIELVSQWYHCCGWLAISEAPLLNMVVHKVKEPFIYKLTCEYIVVVVYDP